MLCFLLPWLLLGCGRSAAPISPDTSSSEVFPQGAVPDPTVLPFGTLDFVIDAGAATAELVRSTEAAPHETITSDLSSLMRQGAALRLEGIRRIDAQTLGLTIGIRHPVPLPPAGRAPRHHATDVLGIFLFDDAHGMEFSDDTGQKPTERLVPGWVEADGYTKRLQTSFQQAFPTALTLHPFVMLSEDTRVPNYDPDSESGWLDLRNPVGWNVLPQGADWRSTETRLRLPPGQHRVRLAVQGCIQAIPFQGTDGQPVPIRYAYPEGSLQLPWRVETSVWNPGLYAGAPEDAVCEIDALVHDWQHDGQVDTVLSWSPATDKGLLREPGTLSQGAYILAPDLMGHFQSNTPWPSQITLTESLFRTTFQVVNATSAPAGEYWALVVIPDTRTHGHFFDSAGLELPAAGELEYVTAQVVRVPVFPGSGPDYITRLAPGPSPHVYLDEGDTMALQPVAIWKSGARTPVDPASYRLEVSTERDAEGLVIESPVTLRRVLPYDERLEVMTQLLPLDPADRIRATFRTVLGDPWVDQAQLIKPGCGGSTTGVLAERIFGGPRGAGSAAGNTDHVVSLGYDGVLIVAMLDGYILNHPGPDFIVFENAFEIGQDPEQIFTETVKVEVSQNGQIWHAFPIDYRPEGDLPWRRPWNFTGVAGITPVLANVDTNQIDPTDPAVAGGDAFDLDVVGLDWARFIRLSSTGLHDESPCKSGCPEAGPMLDGDGDIIMDEGKRGTCSGTIGGPDIDAIAIVRGHQGFPDA